MELGRILFCCLLVQIAVAAPSAEIDATPANPMPGQKVHLTIPRPDPNAHYSWSATEGRFATRPDRATVLFVAPEMGSAPTITCFETVGGTTRVRNRTLLISRQQPAPSGSRGDQGNTAGPEPYDIGRGGFAPSGWMGDGEEQGGFVTDIVDDHPPSGPPARRWVYHPKGAGWGAVAYQFPPGNWGDKPGRDLGGKGYQEVCVWAKGIPDKAGRYPVVQFKAGGGSDPSKKYQASFETEGDFLTLKPEWFHYSVRLGKDLSSVISAFTFVVRADDNPRGATFLLSGIEYR